ncbi:HAD family hydrolase [Pseudonocardiaceae bacterium YIM PH 21723]|nr:HAD family hydrolase [Pseudonocardiaceae bacterium YIM PH 21723]
MEQPRLVASDVDGTLLNPWEQVTERTAAAVARVQATSTPFVLVTGRPPRWVHPVAKAVAVSGYAVCANGAVVYDLARDEVVSAAELSPMLLHDAVHALHEAIPGCKVAVERVGHPGNPFQAEPGYLHAWPDADSAIVPLDALIGSPAIKLLVRAEQLRSRDMLIAAEAVLRDAVDITYSTDNGLIELAVRGITKATGLATVCAELGVEAKDVVAFGDMPNDIAMLGWAGHGVAMANAHPDVLAVADEVTAPNSEDGVALVLERWF